MAAVAFVSVCLLAAITLPKPSSATGSRSFAEGHTDAEIRIAEAMSYSRSLLAQNLAPVPAPSPAKASAPGLGPAVARNVSELYVVFGTAINPALDIIGDIVTKAKNYAQGSQCVIFGSTIAGSCESEDRPVPACCTSQSNSAVCNTFDNGGDVTCSTASQPFPACCENRNQPLSVCTNPDINGKCDSDDFPVPACCKGSLCTVFTGGESVSCTLGGFAQCCPS